MKTIRRFIATFGVSVVVVGSLLTLVTPISVSATAASSTPASLSVADCSKPFLTFPPWFNGLVKVAKGAGGPECQIESPDDVGGLSVFIWHIVLNVIDIGLQGVGYVAAGFILYGGFLFLTASGDAQLAAKARKTLLDAVIGLGISIASVAIVNLLSGLLVHNP